MHTALVWQDKLVYEYIINKRQLLLKCVHIGWERHVLMLML